MELRRWLFCRLLPAVVLLAAGAAAASTLTNPGELMITFPGGLTGTTVAAEPQLAGRIVEDLITPFSYDGWLDSFNFNTGEDVITHGNVTGTVQSRVVLGVDGTYDFYWRIHVNNDSFLAVLGFRLGGIVPAVYNADWRSDSTGDVPPGRVSQGPDGIAWDFVSFEPPSSQIGRGEDSYFFFLDSGAHGYTKTGTFSLVSGRDSGGNQMVQWGGSSGPYATFAPVPEPASLALLLAGLAALGAVRGRRRSPAC